MTTILLVVGVLMNLVAAWVLFTGALYIGIPRLVDSIEQGANQWLLVAEVVADSPAFVAGLSPGDRITSVVASDGEELAVLHQRPLVISFKSAAGSRWKFHMYVEERRR